MPEPDKGDSFVGRLLSTTSLESLRDASRPAVLRRALRARDLIAVGLGTMIGGGIFTTIGPGVKQAGPAIILAFVLAGLASFFAALCYAELGAMVPDRRQRLHVRLCDAGPTRRLDHRLRLIFEYGVSAAPVAQQFSSAFQDALQVVRVRACRPGRRPRNLIYDPHAWWNVAKWDLAHSQYDVVGALFVLLLSVLLSLGIRETAAVEQHVRRAEDRGADRLRHRGCRTVPRRRTSSPFAPLGWGRLSRFRAVTVPASCRRPRSSSSSYIGFDTATTTAEETRVPQRDVPIGVIGSLAIGTVIYCAVAIVLVGVVPWQHVDQNAALAAAVAPLHNPFVNLAITIGVLAGTTSVALTSLARADAHLLRHGARPDAAAVRRAQSTRASRRRRS